MTFGEKLKAARKEAGLSQEQLSEKLSVSRSAVAKWESDRGMPDVSNLKAMGELLGVSIDYLLDEDEKISFNETKDPIDLESFEKTGKCRDKKDAACYARYSDADAIYPLIRRKKLNGKEILLDLVTSWGTSQLVDYSNDSDGYYLVEKDNQHVSALFHYKKITDSDLGIMQNMIDEVESGKYDSKKTLSDRIHEAVQDRQLTSYMNKTKWAELLDEIGDIPDALIMYKTLFENDAPKFYWTIAGDEQFFHMNMAQIEWLKIADTITESKHQGMLLEPKITEKYIGDRIKDILEEHSINYEYIEAEKSFLIFGYR